MIKYAKDDGEEKPGFRIGTATIVRKIVDEKYIILTNAYNFTATVNGE